MLNSDICRQMTTRDMRRRVAAIGLLLVPLLAPERAAAFDEVKGWTGYCLAEFRNEPAVANASLVFGVPPILACDCIAPRMARQTTPADHDFIVATGRMPPRLRSLFGELLQACLILYGRN
jgi:hypothetical protein